MVATSRYRTSKKNARLLLWSLVVAENQAVSQITPFTVCAAVYSFNLFTMMSILLPLVSSFLLFACSFCSFPAYRTFSHPPSMFVSMFLQKWFRMAVMYIYMSQLGITSNSPIILLSQAIFLHLHSQTGGLTAGISLYTHGFTKPRCQIILVLQSSAQVLIGVTCWQQRWREWSN